LSKCYNLNKNYILQPTIP